MYAGPRAGFVVVTEKFDISFLGNEEDAPLVTYCQLETRSKFCRTRPTITRTSLEYAISARSSIAVTIAAWPALSYIHVR